MGKNNVSFNKAALILGLSKSELDREIGAGNIAALRIGVRTFITYDELERYRLECLPQIQPPTKIFPAQPRGADGLEIELDPTEYHDVFRTGQLDKKAGP